MLGNYFRRLLLFIAQFQQGERRHVHIKLPLGEFLSHLSGRIHSFADLATNDDVVLWVFGDCLHTVQVRGKNLKGARQTSHVFGAQHGHGSSGAGEAYIGPEGCFFGIRFASWNKATTKKSFVGLEQESMPACCSRHSDNSVHFDRDWLPVVFWLR